MRYPSLNECEGFNLVPRVTLLHAGAAQLLINRIIGRRSDTREGID